MKQVSRRNFLKLAGLGLLASGCTPIIDTGLAMNQTTLSATALTPASSSMIHLLNRATFGATSSLANDIQIVGMDAWLNQQFDYTAIDDWETQLRLQRFDTLPMTSDDLLSFISLHDRTSVANQLAAAMVLRAVHSKRQLYEKMVHFWSDHFNIHYFKGRTSTLQTVDDRTVSRPYALGNFGDMLVASAHSPAMLIYLDNVSNERSHPNENYAREIMELHTLGVAGDYTESDVVEVARCFTGWSVADITGKFEFRPEWHDDGEKVVLGHVIAAGGGKSDGDRVLDILIDHPNTARYLSSKLLQRFVEDAPSETVINDISRVWIQSRGHIETVMRAIFAHDAFWQAPRKFKRPLEYAISALRSLNASYDGSFDLVERLETMGQRPFGYPTPDGYPDVADEWVGSFVPRWNFAQAIAQGQQAGVSIPIQQWQNIARSSNQMGLARAILQRDANDAEAQALTSVLSADDTLNQNTVRNLLAILLSSPAFQWR